MTNLYRELLNHKNDYLEAERFSQNLQALFPHREISPTDFLYDKNEISDTVLDHHAAFKKWLKIAETVGISKETLTAFCKNVDNLQSVFFLKSLGHIFYPEWLTAIFLYLHGEITKAELQATVVEYSLFSGKAVPPHLSLFRKTLLEIEKTLAQIEQKQLAREIKRTHNLL
jgi:hypothetical protein